MCVSCVAGVYLFMLIDGMAQLWISVTAFLHFFAQQPSTDQAEAGTSKTEVLGRRSFSSVGSGAIPLNSCIAAIFAPIFFRDASPSFPLITPIQKRVFLLYFIG